MRREISALTTRRPVRIFVIADAATSTNAARLADPDRTIPVMGDTTELGVQTSWGAMLRDIVVLDEQNRRIAVYNLNFHNLADAPSYMEFKDLLVREGNRP